MNMLRSAGTSLSTLNDGYHSFKELYDHRIQIYIALCNAIVGNHRAPFNGPYTDSYPVWRSQTQSDGQRWEGWFLLGINYLTGTQITYHIPMEYWDQFAFADELEQAPTFDGHTSADVLTRLKDYL